MRKKKLKRTECDFFIGVERFVFAKKTGEVLSQNRLDFRWPLLRSHFKGKGN